MDIKLFVVFLYNLFNICRFIVVFHLPFLILINYLLFFFFWLAGSLLILLICSENQPLGSPIFSIVFLFSISLISSFILIISFLLLMLYLFHSFSTFFIVGAQIIDVKLFLSPNVCILCHQFVSHPCFSRVPQILICCIFIFIQFIIFLNFTWDFLFNSLIV